MLLVIDRSQWRCGGFRGYGKGETFLLNKEGYMCCLGFRCLAHDETLDILSHQNPNEVAGAPKKLKKSETLCTRFAESAIEINDDEDITNEVRERRLRALAKRNNEKWIFVGEYGPPTRP